VNTHDTVAAGRELSHPKELTVLVLFPNRAGRHPTLHCAIIKTRVFLHSILFRI
jgi:hypothetical protein